MAENTVRLRAANEVWDSVGCGPVAAEHFGYGSGDVVDVPREHAHALLKTGGYVMAEQPTSTRVVAGMSLIRYKDWDDDFRRDPPAGADEVGPNRFVTEDSHAAVLCESHGYEIVRDGRGVPIPVASTPDPRDLAVDQAKGAIQGMTATLSARDQEIARLRAHIGELDKALSAAAEQNLILQAHVDELTEPPMTAKEVKAAAKAEKALKDDE